MAQEEKELLLKDLSARLPYGVIVAYKSRESDRCNCDLFFKIGLGYGNIGYVAELGRGWWTDLRKNWINMKNLNGVGILNSYLCHF